MERVGDGQPMDPAAVGAELVRHRGYTALGARKHHRRRTVDRRDANFCAQQRPHLFLGGLHREHRPARRESLHEPAPGGHQYRGVLQREDAGDVCRGQLANRVAHHEIGVDPPGLQQPEQCHFHREQGGLSEFGGVQQVFVLSPHHIAQWAQQVPVQFSHDGVECLGEYRVSGVQSPSHAKHLGALAREHEYGFASGGRGAADD